MFMYVYVSSKKSLLNFLVMEMIYSFKADVGIIVVSSNKKFWKDFWLIILNFVDSLMKKEKSIGAIFRAISFYADTQNSILLNLIRNVIQYVFFFFI